MWGIRQIISLYDRLPDNKRLSFLTLVGELDFSPEPNISYLTCVSTLTTHDTTPGDEESNVENFQRNTSDKHSKFNPNQNLSKKDTNARKFSAELNKHAVFTNLHNKRS